MLGVGVWPTRSLFSEDCLLNESFSLKTPDPPALSKVFVLYVSLPSVILAEIAYGQYFKQARLFAAKNARKDARGAQQHTTQRQMMALVDFAS
jgi:hypothetical protein